MISTKTVSELGIGQQWLRLKLDMRVGRIIIQNPLPQNLKPQYSRNKFSPLQSTLYPSLTKPHGITFYKVPSEMPPKTFIHLCPKPSHNLKTKWSFIKVHNLSGSKVDPLCNPPHMIQSCGSMWPHTASFSVVKMCRYHETCEQIPWPSKHIYQSPVKGFPPYLLTYNVCSILDVCRQIEKEWIPPLLMHSKAALKPIWTTSKKVDSVFSSDKFCWKSCGWMEVSVRWTVCGWMISPDVCWWMVDEVRVCKLLLFDEVGDLTQRLYEL